MNKNNDPMLRALYIILVPVVLLIILLNSGMLQKMVPAARMHGRTYSVAQYNYYYFDNYNDFLEAHENELEELGYDPSQSENRQLTEDGITWKEYFQRLAEVDMAQTAYYCDKAAAAGYEFSPEELLPVEEKLADNAARQAASGISAKNFYTAYYGAGMTEAIYTAELTRQVKAAAYREYLIRTNEPTEAEIAAWIAENDVPEYEAVDLRVITLDALPDRETGEVGLAQLAALQERVNRLMARYAAGESFEDLQAAFSTCAFGDSRGYLYNATRLDMPAVAAAWCLGEYYPVEEGSAGTLVDQDENRAYLLILDGFRGSGPEREAAIALGEDALLTAAQEEIGAEYRIARQRFGMLLATA